MNSEFEKDFWFDRCNNCDQEGVFFLDDIFIPHLVACPYCTKELLSVFCHECETGFALPNEDRSRKTNWICPDCQVEHQLSEKVYAQPVQLYLKSDLPEDVRMRVFPAKSSLNDAIFIMIAIVAAGILVFIKLLR